MRIAFVGLGSLGFHLAKRMLEKGIQIHEVVTSNESMRHFVEHDIKAKLLNHVEQISADIQLIIMAVPDDAISQVKANIPGGDFQVVHTSGSTDLSAISGAGIQPGVIYPLQTFSQNREPDWKEIPVFIESTNYAFEQILFQLATKIGGEVHAIDSQTRRILHLAAVFACNFSNHLIHISQNKTESVHLPASILNPLLKETIDKAMSLGGDVAQTGPAKRGDLQTIKKHLDLLSYDQIEKEIYQVLSSSIEYLHKSQ